MRLRHRFLCALLLTGINCLALADVDLPSKFSNQGSVANTRHNMTQRQPAGGGPNGAIMDPYRADYGEVCVYCHTPHGASATYRIPLWNRTIVPTSYQTYTTLGSATMTQPVTQPGLNSLACLSCHDGQVAVDSIINMPGSGRYLASQETSQSNTFLSTWTNPSGPGPFAHMGLSATECLACHSPGAGPVGAGATDFTAFVIGTDLRNDHPVGVRFPAAGPGVDFNAPGGVYANLRFFDANGNGRPDRNEIRVFDTGEGHEVECASCHDPHGVPSAGPGSVFNRGFLRVSNAASALCLTCHAK
jgi:mono/diheme cytochrome c family protein